MHRKTSASKSSLPPAEAATSSAISFSSDSVSSDIILVPIFKFIDAISEPFFHFVPLLFTTPPRKFAVIPLTTLFKPFEIGSP
jgi:hypothetical protein